jgi:hypothetical protein
MNRDDEDFQAGGSPLEARISNAVLVAEVRKASAAERRAASRYQMLASSTANPVARGVLSDLADAARRRQRTLLRLQVVLVAPTAQHQNARTPDEGPLLAGPGPGARPVAGEAATREVPPPAPPDEEV